MTEDMVGHKLGEFSARRACSAGTRTRRRASRPADPPGIVAVKVNSHGVYRSTHRFARIAPRKARLVADLIRGMPIDQRDDRSWSSSKKRVRLVLQGVLKSAIANAEEHEADVQRAPGRQPSRAWTRAPPSSGSSPKDRGRAHPIRKRTSHLYITVDERPEREELSPWDRRPTHSDSALASPRLPQVPLVRPQGALRRAADRGLTRSASTWTSD